jgi:hypothetical protein
MARGFADQGSYLLAAWRFSISCTSRLPITTASDTCPPRVAVSPSRMPKPDADRQIDCADLRQRSRRPRPDRGAAPVTPFSDT